MYLRATLLDRSSVLAEQAASDEKRTGGLGGRPSSEGVAIAVGANYFDFFA